MLFRDFVAKHAQNLALVGYVHNAPDSTVEVVAQGDHDDLEKLIEHLREGSLLARVSSVDIERRAPTESFDSFRIE